MVKYFHQNWLLDCPYGNIDLKDYVVTVEDTEFIQDICQERNLFDYGREELIRKVNISVLDEITDSQSEWNDFLKKTKSVDILILWDDRKETTNKILSQYLYATRQAYVWHLENANINCILVANPNSFC